IVSVVIVNVSVKLINVSPKIVNVSAKLINVSPKITNVSLLFPGPQNKKEKAGNRSEDPFPAFCSCQKKSMPIGRLKPMNIVARKLMKNSAQKTVVGLSLF